MTGDLQGVYIAKLRQTSQVSMTTLSKGPTGTIPSVDMYSLGCLFIELFGQKRVWSGFVGMQIMQKVCGSFGTPPVSPNTSHIPSNVRKVCQECCRLQSKERPNITRVIEMLQEAMGSPMTKSPTSWTSCLCSELKDLCSDHPQSSTNIKLWLIIPVIPIMITRNHLQQTQNVRLLYYNIIHPQSSTTNTKRSIVILQQQHHNTLTVARVALYTCIPTPDYHDNITQMEINCTSIDYGDVFPGHTELIQNSSSSCLKVFWVERRCCICTFHIAMGPYTKVQWMLVWPCPYM